MSKKIHRECFELLLQNSLKSIPFNIILAAIISFYFWYSGVMLFYSLIWFLAIFLICSIRWYYSYHLLQKKMHFVNQDKLQQVFVFLTSLMGVMWGVGYFLFFSYLSQLNEIIIILVLGGLASGALASLSVYMPAYYAYLLPMFLPVIVYNFYTMEFERIILATTFVLFVIMLIVTAKITSRLLHETIVLTIEKDNLILRLKKANQKQQKALGTIRKLSVTDALTGLYNRRYFEVKLKDESHRAKKNKHPLNLVFIDVDNFKIINDSFGHPYGDIFLKDLANAIKNSTQRVHDTAFRLGGDEFAAIFTNTSLEEAIHLCSSMKEHFQKNNRQKHVTISIGILCIPPSFSEDLDEIISTADKILYQAKKTGKNKIISQRL
ncbi:hypothetical protein A8135_08775 [Legionella jamestowniensis]|uniref:diguanylate cyclase n=2 Tax=Legionella jamestowniensis TaxID=455 RepID=A0A0W0UW53_9GAMM|nr:two component response regulator with GGDEF domain protein [Legionella jamestowniensis]OCH98847.1 hypothetical protein A8135_08775 [Legionella jamestowniensis]SFL72498.1 diguanylate cyclase (GGDEF) domain-containing protein [Legionella jamestowniensis DSM 19215]